MLLAEAGQAQSPAAPAPTPAPSTIIGSGIEPTQLGKLSVLGTAPDWKKLELFAGSMTREEFQKAWSEIYAEEKALPPPFEVTQEALLVPTGESGEGKIRVPFRAVGQSGSPVSGSWRRAAELPPLRGRPLLSDLHIALDPGHIGGGWAVMEERFLSFKPGEDIREGDMSLLTAKILKERLIKLGAVVSLVRENNDPVTLKRPADLEKDARQLLLEAGFPDPKPGYQDTTGDAKLLTVQWQSEKLFYRVSEIHARGQRVNEQIKPDLVLCLHFNAESWGAADAPQFSPKNHLHILVNGCYSNAELMQRDVRFEMLRRLFGRVHEEELPLAVAVADGMARRTGLPAYIYTTPNARKVPDNPFVYARNLLANRIYQCPVVYLEPYVMNHEETYRRLLAGHYIGRTLIGGRLVSSAIEDYVRGVVDGLVNYYQNHRRDS
jgi:N-acetylmuramoyl-L-alanine amidase